MTLEPSSPISGPAPAQGHADRDLRSSFYPPVASTTFGTTWAHVHSPLGWHQLRAPQSPQERLQALDTPPVDRQQPHNTLDHSCAEQCTNISSRTAEAQQPAVSGSGSRSTHRGANASFGKWTLQPLCIRDVISGTPPDGYHWTQDPGHAATHYASWFPLPLCQPYPQDVLGFDPTHQ